MTNAEKIAAMRAAIAVLDGSCSQNLWLLMETERVLAAPLTPSDDPASAALMAQVAAAKTTDPGGPCSGRAAVVDRLVDVLGLPPDEPLGDDA